ncbi:MAG: choice-of-anchor X domain-containing protein [Phycisphaerales bacterium]
MGVGITATLALALAAHAGEDCASATPVGLGTTPITAGAVTDAFPAASCNGFDAYDVYFTFTPATTGAYDFNTCGASASQWFDTVLSVYSGTCGATTQIGCNDDNGNTACGPNGWSSSVNGLALTGGQTYLIRVAAYDEFSTGDGNGFLTIAAGSPPPPGETCAAAIPAVLGTNNFNTTGMTNDATTACGGSGPDIYFRFVPATTGPHVFSLCGSSFDTVIQLFDDSCVSISDCDDASCGDALNNATITVNMTAGVPVRIQVDGWGGANGAGVLTILDTVPLGIQGGYSAGPELSTVQVGAFVTPGTGSTNIQAVADLSSIGGSATQALYDDGTHGDPVAGDNVYIFEYTFPITVLTGTYDYPISVSDAEGHSATGTSTVDVLDGPAGACCVSGSCSVTRQTLCFASAGAWQGNGSNCGGDVYSATASGAAFTSIAGTGTMLANVSNCDDCVEDLAMPFAWSFFGNPVTNVSVSSNGNLQFVAPGTGAATYTNTPIPDAATPNNAIYPAWDDYNASVAGDVYYQVDGVAPNRTLTISWEGITEYGATNSNSFQVVISENSSSYSVRYGDTANLPEAFAGDVTIGAENADGTSAGTQDAATVSGNTAYTWSAQTLPSPCGPSCDSIDFNHDDLFPDTQDIDDFLSVFSGGPCTNDPNCGDIDFNNDDLFPDTMDIDALLSVFSGGPCVV